jgi:phosphoglycerate dehydrogenase-like enzyme
MKKGAVLYNIGRGATVDQEALLACVDLRSPRLRLAGCYRTGTIAVWPPAAKVPNCFITPHIAGGHRNELQMLVRHFLKNLPLFLEGAPLQDRVM